MKSSETGASDVDSSAASARGEMPAETTRPVEVAADEKPPALAAIIALLQSRTDGDFDSYKKGTILRRIQRRMRLRRVDSLETYLAVLEETPAEVDSLFHDLLIGVTHFFRDPGAWRHLDETALGPLIADAPSDEPIRIWVPGCATGEEAYGMAMLVFEQCAARGRDVGLQLYGTDLDETSIAVARKGIYPSSIREHLSEDRLERFFEEEHGHFRVSRDLRDACVFAFQDLVSDPPFPNLDLISCRNLLIYLKPEVQAKLMRQFHFALRENGLLFLGSAESTTAAGSLFAPMSKTHRIFRRLGQAERRRDAGRRSSSFRSASAVSRSRLVLATGPGSGTSTPPRHGTVELARRTLLDRFAPASVLVTADHEVQYFHGDLRDIIATPAGQPTSDLLSMCADGLRGVLRSVIHRAILENRRAEATATHVVGADDGQEGTASIRVLAEPIIRPSAADTPLVLVSFLSAAAPPPPRRADAATNSDASNPPAPRTADGDETARTADDLQGQVDHLEFELFGTSENLQRTIEDLRSSNDGLTASNEQVLSMNEELQAANEELETSREELQSLNEELGAVNGQLQAKVEEIENANNDLLNFLASTDIAIIFLDEELRIRRFNPVCTEILHVIASDKGRPISDLAAQVDDPHLATDAREVLRTRLPIERDVVNDDGRLFSRRILPYRTSGDHIGGVVVTLADVTRLGQIRRQLEDRLLQQSAVAELGRFAMTAATLRELHDAAVNALARTLGADFAKVLKREPDGRFRMLAGVGWNEGLVGHARVPGDRDSQPGYTFSVDGPVLVSDHAHERRFSAPPLLVEHGVASGMSVTIGSEDDRWGVLGVHAREPRAFTSDDEKFLQTVANILFEAGERRESELLVHTIMENATQAVALMDDRGYCTYCNEALLEMTGYDEQEIRSRPLHELIHHHHPDGRPYPKEDCPINRAMPNGTRMRSHEDLFFRKDGTPFPVLCAASPVRNQGTVIEIRDLSTYRETTLALRRSEQQLRLAKDAAELGIHDYNPVTGHIEWDEQCRAIWGLDPGEEPTFEVFMEGLHEDDREATQRAVDEAIDPDGDRYYRAEYRVRNRRDGQWRWVLAVGDVQFEDRTPVRLIGTVQDITELKQSQERLAHLATELEERVTERTAVAERRARELRTLAAQIGQAEQRARQAVARMIHDDLQQLLIAAKMRLPSDDAPASREQIAVVAELLDESLATTRSLVSDLSPPVLREGSLADAMKWLARRMQAQHQLRVTVVRGAGAGADVRDETVVAVVFECVRELLFNVVKHAGVDAARVILSGDEEQVEVRVVDQGAGLDPATAFKRQDGFGLFAIKERLEAFGGGLTLESASGQGCTFRVRVPLARTTTDAAPSTAAAIEHLRTKRASDPGPRRGDRIRVLITDDHEIVRAGLKSVLAKAKDIEVIGEASDGLQAVEMAHELEPDVVVMDFAMPRMNGAAATERIRSLVPSVAVIGLSLYESGDMGTAMVDAGAIAFVQKDEAATVLLDEIRRATRSE